MRSSIRQQKAPYRRKRARALNTSADRETAYPRCKGESSLDRLECWVDIIITPASAEEPDDANIPGATTVIHTREIEMYAPQKIR